MPSPAPVQTPAPAFTLSVGRKLILVEAPTKAELTVNTRVTVGGNFTKPVTITASGGPAGVKLTFPPKNEDQVTIDPTSTTKTTILTITVGIVVSPAEYAIQIEAGDGSLGNKLETITLVVGTGGDFDLMLGVGSLILKGDVTDYKTNNQNSVLATTNLGRATPQLLTGASFRLPFGNLSKGAKRRIGPRPWYAFLSLKFSPESSQTFSGYVIGGSYKLSKSFAFLAGYALTPIQEHSPGFRSAAVQVVNQNPTVPIYQRFDANALQHNSPNAYDGFPLFVQNASGPTTTRVFAGDPTGVHYHGGLIICVPIPISLKTQLAGSTKHAQKCDTMQIECALRYAPHDPTAARK